MKQFKTESKKLLDLMINSIYTNKEIFLRELISNASDALDKISFESLTHPEMGIDPDSLAITLSFDRDARTVTVSDNGIGMSAEELDRNLGTIAHSGSEQYKEANAEHQGDELDIIGQFGVGFYSSFMVADEVRVVSRAYGADDANVWESDGVRGYAVSPAGPGERDGADDHGTDVILHLRPSTDEDETDRFLSEAGLRDLVERYSNYVRHPIKMMVTKSRQKPKPADAGDDYKPEYETYQELDTINSMTPIWKKRRSEVSDEDYAEFYKSTFHDWADPERTISFHAEGALSYDALLFIPSQAPFDLYSKDYEKGLALYSSNVMIQEKCADLVPDYYNFVRGVVDSPDITLNISRETLQHDSQLRSIARRVESKVTSELEDMRDNDREAYERFFANFGRGIKFGIYSSYGTKADELGDLLLFWSAKQNKNVTLKEYVDAMPEGQDKIFYVGGVDRDVLARSPKVASALDHGYDVLLCTQDVDEFMFQFMRSYHVDEVEAEGDEPAKPARDIELANVTSAELDLATDEEKEAAKKAADDNKELLSAVKDALDGKVDDVRTAAGMGDVPATVATEGPVSLEMERVAQQGPDADQMPHARRVLQLNGEHPVFAKLVAAKEAGDTDRLALYASILYDQALLVEGMPLADPVAFAQNVTKLM